MPSFDTFVRKWGKKSNLLGNVDWNFFSLEIFLSTNYFNAWWERDANEYFEWLEVCFQLIHKWQYNNFATSTFNLYLSEIEFRLVFFFCLSLIFSKAHQAYLTDTKQFLRYINKGFHRNSTHSSRHNTSAATEVRREREIVWLKIAVEKSLSDFFFKNE